MSGAAVNLDREPQQPAALRNLPKHERYASAYRRLGWYWGLGVEHETYIATAHRRTIRTFEGALRPERYSVNYYAAYRPEALTAALADVLATATADSSGLSVPVLMNSHSWTHCDVMGEHRTTYERQPKPNPKYAGKTLADWAAEHSDWLRDEMGRAYMWDGDTVEFMTQDFYCATVERVLGELAAVEERFVAELGRLPRRGVLAAYGPFRLAAPENAPWATYLTAPRSVAMFNNGTIHVNVTLPTRLGWNRQPLWPRAFLEQHRALARLIQWLEPLWIAVYGSGDPFATGAAPRVAERFAAGSQRLAVSRYIGVGTFDTEAMPTGKILQIPRAAAGPLPWYDWLATRATGYAPLDVIGLDLNYSKHWAHGLELRFFDQMPAAALRKVLEGVVVLCDVARALWRRRGGIPDPRSVRVWQEAAGWALWEGAGWSVAPDFLNALLKAGGAGGAAGLKEPLGVQEALATVLKALRGVGDGYCWRVMRAEGGGVAATGCRCF
jgi:hypothetical protein